MAASESAISRLLEHLHRVQPLPPAAREAVAEITAVVSVKKHQDLQTIGQTCRTIYLVDQGTARIYYYKDGKDITEYFAFENDLIIRAESLFTGRPSHKAIQTISDTCFVAIPAQALFNLFEAHRDVERLFRKLVEQAYVETIQRLESLQFHPAEARYQALLAKSPEVVREIPLKYIASYLGITQVSLSRIRARQS